MTQCSPVAPLTDIIEAIDLIQSDMAGVTLDAFEADRRKRWLVERGIEIMVPRLYLWVIEGRIRSAASR